MNEITDNQIREIDKIIRKASAEGVFGYEEDKRIVYQSAVDDIANVLGLQETRWI